MTQLDTLSGASTQPLVLQLHESDSVAVALAPLDSGQQVEAGGTTIRVREPIPRGHKLALRSLEPGDTVRKFGWAIGRVTAPAQPGDHVHTHNLETLLKGVEGYSFQPAPAGSLPSDRQARFSGYRRGDGRVGTRNEIWILPTVGCVSRTAERIAQIAHARHSGAVDGVFAFTHPHGCSQLGDDLAGTRSLLAALACHPNAGGVLIIGLGCESNRLDALLQEIPEPLRARVRTLKAQSVEDETEAGLAEVDALVARANLARREPVAPSELVVRLKCGGSDGFSGLTANPLVGRISDRVIGAGGTTVLTEIPEIFGAERQLMIVAGAKLLLDGAGIG